MECICVVYDDFINKIHNENCEDTMQRMMQADFRVDNIITSPPYNTVRTGEYYSTDDSINKHVGRYDEYTEDLTDDEYITWTIGLFNSFDKILKSNGCILYNMSYSTENTTLIWEVLYNIIKKTKFTIADTIIWRKDTALPVNTSPNKLTRICEHIFVFCRQDEIDTFHSNKKIKSTRTDTGQSYYENISNYIRAPNNDGACELNKATYSTELILKLLKIYVQKDNIVYDPFMGTGTTANACKQYGVNYVGSEISKAQVEYANKRLNYKTLNDYF